MKNILKEMDETALSFIIGAISGALNALLTRKKMRNTIITTITGGIVAVLAAPYLHVVLNTFIYENPQNLFYLSVFAVGLFAKDGLEWILNNKKIWLNWLISKYLNIQTKKTEGKNE